MKEWLLKFFDIFPFFSKDEYDQQVAAERAAHRAAEHIERENETLRRRIGPFEDGLFPDQRGRR